MAEAAQARDNLAAQLAAANGARHALQAEAERHLAYQQELEGVAVSLSPAACTLQSDSSQAMDACLELVEQRQPCPLLPWPQGAAMHYDNLSQLFRGAGAVTVPEALRGLPEQAS